MPEPAKTVDSALTLLLEIAGGGPGSAADLARRTGLNRTVTHRLLRTMEGRGFVRREDRGPYDLGLVLVDLGHRVEPGLREIVLPALKKLVAGVGETAVFAIADGRDAVALEEVRATGHLVRVEYRPGLRHPLWQTAHGRAILAFLPRGGAGYAFDGTGEAAAAAASRRRQLDDVRARGYATSHDELQSGTAGVAAPVRDRTGFPVGSVGVVCPIPRLPEETFVARAVLGAAGSIEEALVGRRVRPIA